MKARTASVMRKGIRQWKRERFEEVLAKGKIENMLDAAAVFYGLSKNAVELAAYAKIVEMAKHGHSPKDIVDCMEVKRK